MTAWVVQRGNGAGVTYCGLNGTLKGKRPPASIVVSLSTVLYTENPAANATYMGYARLSVRAYSCISPTQHVPTAGNRANSTGIVAGRPWDPSAKSLEILTDTDVQLLPQGVAAQIVNSNPTGAGQFDRYLRTSSILFNAKGEFESRPWSVGQNTRLGQLMNLRANL